MQRGLRGIIDPAHLSPIVLCGLQLHGGLKAIDDEAQRSIDLAELVVGLDSREPYTAYRLAHNCAIFLVG